MGFVDVRAVDLPWRLDLSGREFRYGGCVGVFPERYRCLDCVTGG